MNSQSALLATLAVSPLQILLQPSPREPDVRLAGRVMSRFLCVAAR